MAERRIVTLPMGEGLERSKGVMVVRPTSFEDIRNMFLFDGKAQVRNGLLLKSVLQDDQPVDLDVTVMLSPLRSEAASIGVGYNTTGGTNREIWINRMEINGENPFAVGLYGVLPVDASFEPPIIIGADSDNRFFFAHDEPKSLSRLVTKVYDPNEFPNIFPLEADLDGEGDAEVFFRGVVRHLSYIFGWGFGSALDPNRDDVIRVSNSGDSTVFEDFAFFEAGQQGEVVMTCRSAGPSLMVFKENETYEIFGYSPDTFGIRLADSLFGAVGSRLAVSVAGTVFFWSTQGPRLTNGGPSDDIAVPLDIGGPDPAGLVDESDPQDAFVEYDPATRVVNFVWGQRVYALSIRDPSKPRWSYYELGETAQCGGLFFSSQSKAGSGGPPIGAPEDLIFQLADPATQTATFASNPDGESIYIDAIRYRFSTFVNTNTPNVVKIGATISDTIDNFVAAINLTGTPGTEYSLGTLVIHPTVSAVNGGGDTMEITGKVGHTGYLMVVDSDLGALFPDVAIGTGTITWIDSAPFDYFSNQAGSNNFNVADMIGGAGPEAATQVDIEFTNVDLLGGEDIEVLISTDGGVTFSFGGAFPATGPSGGQQTLSIFLENQSSGKKIQPLTDYVFALRYRLGGLFSPGYDGTPDTWPAASQGSTLTSAEEITWILRAGDNQGIWSMISAEIQLSTLSPNVPSGHELIDIHVHIFKLPVAQVPSDPEIGSILGLSELFGTRPYFREIWNADTAGYPTQYITEWTRATDIPANKPSLQQMAEWGMRFASKDGLRFGGMGLYLPQYCGPDPPLRESLNSVLGNAPITEVANGGDVTWANATTPSGRIDPPPGPNLHTMELWTLGVDRDTPENTAEGIVAAEFATQNQSFTLDGGFGPNTVGDEFQIGIRHIISYFGLSSIRSQFCFIVVNATGSAPNYRTFLYAGVGI